MFGDTASRSDNTLYFSMGDASNYNTEDFPRAYRAQKPDSLNGKVMHVDKDGRGLAGNPFWNGNPLSNRSRVWSMGERTPFRMNLKGDQLYTANAGNVTWEEVNLAGKGLNNGWPCYEGGSGTNVREPRYGPKPICQTLYASNPTIQPPAFAYNHAGTTAAISGLVFYTGTSYPAMYRGRAFYGDYGTNVIGTVQLNAAGTATVDSSIFATGVPAVVDLETATNGDILVLDISKGSVERLTYGAVACAADSWRASYWSNMNQSGNPVLVRCEPKGSPALNKAWGAGGPIAGVVDKFRRDSNATAPSPTVATNSASPPMTAAESRWTVEP